MSRSLIAVHSIKIRLIREDSCWETGSYYMECTEINPAMQWHLRLVLPTSLCLRVHSFC